MQCTSSGYFTYQLYADSLSCVGEGKKQAIALNICALADSANSTLFSNGLDSACCQPNPSSKCRVGVPQISGHVGENTGLGQTFLNGSPCDLPPPPPSSSLTQSNIDLVLAMHNEVRANGMAVVIIVRGGGSVFVLCIS